MDRRDTTIVFKGGKMDGKTLEDVDVKELPTTLKFRGGIYYEEDEDGALSLATGALNSKWNCYCEERYNKADNDYNKPVTVFEFSEMLNIGRCVVEENGKRCMNPAEYGETHCIEAHKP